MTVISPIEVHGPDHVAQLFSQFGTLFHVFGSGVGCKHDLVALDPDTALGRPHQRDVAVGVIIGSLDIEIGAPGHRPVAAVIVGHGFETQGQGASLAQRGGEKALADQCREAGLLEIDPVAEHIENQRCRTLNGAIARAAANIARQ